jgi:[ribosomal protein S5]-alanine N-acetyltransferase
MENYLLSTERLYLKHITPTLVHRLFSSQTKAEIMRFLGVDEQGYEKYKMMYENGMETYQISFQYFLLIHKYNNQPIGECGFHTWHKKHAKAELFYFLRNDTDKQKGFMKEALQPILEFGFTKMSLHRIQALIAGSNLPSLKLASYFGFKKEGVLRQDYYVNEQYEDSECYSLLKNEWRWASDHL